MESPIYSTIAHWLASSSLGTCQYSALLSNIPFFSKTDGFGTISATYNESCFTIPNLKL